MVPLTCGCKRATAREARQINLMVSRCHGWRACTWKVPSLPPHLISRSRTSCSQQKVLHDTNSQVLGLHRIVC